jgi:CBS domain containing-hemolysin-like protein
MVPRRSIGAIAVTSTFEEVKRSFRTLGYSRLPVYRKHLDDIVGVIFRRDLEPFLEQEPLLEFDLEKLLHPPLFVPATARLGTVLKQMQSARTHLAFAVNEHGGLEGIVTLEDLLEEIVGEIDDEFDEEVRSQIVEENGTYLLDGMLAVRDANRRLNLNLPEVGNYTTLAGFLLAKTGRLLRQGEVVEHEGAHLTVERVERQRIRRVRYLPAMRKVSG